MSSASSMSTRLRRWAPWALLAVVVIGALAVGTGNGEAHTDEERAHDIAETVRCPACSGQSVANSDAIAAQNLRNDIERRVAAGESDDEIRAAIAARFGDDILLNPPRSGVAGLVWVLPVFGLVIAAAALTFAFRRWRQEW